MSLTNTSFLSSIQFENLLGLPVGNRVGARIQASLFGPILDLYSRQGKQVRGTLVELGFRFSGVVHPHEPLTDAQRQLIDTCGDVIEAIHAGSLIVDDIQDGSKVRRGQPSLHLKYGLPIALNAGNWLYFWPLERIRMLGLPPGLELEAYHACHQLMIRAHFGQALDVGVRIDEVPQSETAELCRASMELKSGALMGLAFEFGAIISQATTERRVLLRDFGKMFGLALQAFDDLGNLTDIPPLGLYDSSKRFEDFYLRRPSWVWYVAAQEFSTAEFARFVDAVQHLPDETFLRPWLDLHGFIRVATKKAAEQMHQALAFLNSELSMVSASGLDYSRPLAQVRDLAQKVMNAYGA